MTVTPVTDEDVDHAVAALRHKYGTEEMVSEDAAIRVALEAFVARRQQQSAGLAVPFNVAAMRESIGAAYRAVIENRWGDAQMTLAGIDYELSLREQSADREAGQRPCSDDDMSRPVRLGARRGWCACRHHRGEHGPLADDPHHMLDAWGRCTVEGCACAAYQFHYVDEPFPVLAAQGAVPPVAPPSPAVATPPTPAIEDASRE